MAQHVTDLLCQGVCCVKMHFNAMCHFKACSEKIWLLKCLTYGVMVSVPSFLSTQNIHLSPQRGHSGSIPVILN